MSKKYPWLADFNVKAFLVCLLISTGLWLLIKLSEEFDTQNSFEIKLVDVPTSQMLTDNEQLTVKFSLHANGFETLGSKLLADSKRIATISLSKIPYRVENGSTYSFNSQYVAEQIANILDVSASDITMNEDKVYFEMEEMKSKVVPVVLQSDIHTQQRFDIYGLPIIEPAIVTVYGPMNVLDTVESVSTQLLSRSGVNGNIVEQVGLDLCDGLLHCDVTEVTVNIEVLQFTEQELVVPISVPDSLKMRLFPETVKVKFIVAMKDYPSMKADMFHVGINPSQIDGGSALLDLKLDGRPENVELISVDPQRVEYLIVE